MALKIITNSIFPFAYYWMVGWNKNVALDGMPNSPFISQVDRKHFVRRISSYQRSLWALFHVPHLLWLTLFFYSGLNVTKHRFLLWIYDWHTSCLVLQYRLLNLSVVWKKWISVFKYLSQLAFIVGDPTLIIIVDLFKNCEADIVYIGFKNLSQTQVHEKIKKSNNKERLQLDNTIFEITPFKGKLRKIVEWGRSLCPLWAIAHARICP